MRIFRATLPGRPKSGNHRHGYNSKTGAVFITAKAAAYDVRCGYALLEAKRVQKWRDPIVWCSVSWVFWNVDFEGDNLLKTVQDALQRSSVIENDRYIIESHETRKWDEDGPRTDVEVREIDPRESGVPSALIERSATAAARELRNVGARAKAPARARTALAPGLPRKMP